jgi:hypothetical protein
MRRGRSPYDHAFAFVPAREHAENGDDEMRWLVLARPGAVL